MRNRIAGAIAATAMTLCGPGAVAEPPALNVYNWNDYIGPDVLSGFTKLTGIKVNYDVYDSNEMVEAKLSTGKSGYDIVVPTFVPFISRGIKGGLYAEIDTGKLKNWHNVDPAILETMATYDPGNKHAVPWIVGTVGLGINVGKLKAMLPDAPIDSLDLLMKPEYASVLAKCGIVILDSQSDVLPVVLKYLGRDPASETKEDLEAATAALLKIRRYIRKFDSSGYINDLANGDACLVLGYSTDIVIAGARAEEAKNGVEIAYRIPREGTLQYIDAMAIPVDAPHPELALAWIDYNLRPEVMAATANAVNGRSGNKAAAEFARDDFKSNPQIYPTPEIEKTLFGGVMTSRPFTRLRNRAWTNIRLGE